MTADPGTLELLVQTAGILKACASGYQLGTWIAGIATKLEAGLDLSPDEQATVDHVGIVAAASDSAGAQQQAGTSGAASLAVGTVTAGVDLALTMDEAGALAALLAAQMDPLLQGIAAKLATAEGGST